MQEKEISIVFYGRRYPRTDWRFDLDERERTAFLQGLVEELAPFGIRLGWSDQPETILEVRSYGDLLNTVRIQSAQDGLGNLCLGHIIGQSANCDLLDDLRRGVNRIAFAPETIEPEGSSKVVCHNCGCGC